MDNKKLLLKGASVAEAIGISKDGLDVFSFLVRDFDKIPESDLYSQVFSWKSYDFRLQVRILCGMLSYCLRPMGPDVDIKYSVQVYCNGPCTLIEGPPVPKLSLHNDVNQVVLRLYFGDVKKTPAPYNFSNRAFEDAEQESEYLDELIEHCGITQKDYDIRESSSGLCIQYAAQPNKVVSQTFDFGGARWILCTQARPDDMTVVLLTRLCQLDNLDLDQSTLDQPALDLSTLDLSTTDRPNKPPRVFEVRCGSSSRRISEPCSRLLIRGVKGKFVLK